MKLSVSAYRAHASAHKKILDTAYQLNYGSTSASSTTTAGANMGHHQYKVEPLANDEATTPLTSHLTANQNAENSGSDTPVNSPRSPLNTSRDEDDESSNAASSECKSPNQRYGASSPGGHESRTTNSSREDSQKTGNSLHGSLQSVAEATTKAASQSWKNIRAVMTYYNTLRKIKRTKSNQRWMKLRTTVQISSAIQKPEKKFQKPPLKREDSFLKRFSTRQLPDQQETIDDTNSESNAPGSQNQAAPRRRRRLQKHPKTVVNPDENFYFYWLLTLTICILYNMWTLIVRQSFPELQTLISTFWYICDGISDIVFLLDVGVQLRTGYLEQGLMVYDSKKLACHYLSSKAFLLDLGALCPLDLLQVRFGPQPMLRFPRFLKVYRAVNYYYMVESRTVWPNLWRVVNLIHILLILAHWFGCFYFLLSEAEGFQGDWVYPYRPGDYATLTRKYLGSLYWSTLTLTTIGDLPTPETNAERTVTVDGPRSLPRRGLKSRLLQFNTNGGYVFTIVSYLIGVFIFATIVGQVGNVITNRNANRLEFERLLDGAKTYMRHHKVPGGMKKRVLRWYDYSWSRGRIQGGGDINTALGLLPDKLKTELALHVNLSVLKKVTIFQECQPEFLHDLVLKMKAYIFTPGDSICRKGEVAREMFIIADGILEVLSETGRVLTSMKAGDFFGEIGILNLDGLNKRTADVRSVGYSELFSLSREDVLAAMKDYPEAQEILQALGRKRLMEVRNSARQNQRPGSKHHSRGPSDPNETVEQPSARNLVHKLKTEAKGLRNALRKSRVYRQKSDESLELQPLHTPSKGVLKRMPRVKSDEMSQEDPDPGGGEDPKPSTAVPVVTSPLGAGLPLLSRLRLLKEKQDNEERQTHAPSPSCIQSPPVVPEVEEPPSEVIGAGLPLLQRLLLLKAKEDKSKADKTKAAIEPIPVVPKEDSPIVSPKPTTGKVSFRDRIFERPEDPPSASTPDVIKDTRDSSVRQDPPEPEVKTENQTKLPCIVGFIQKAEKCDESCSTSVDSDASDPWSKLKQAAIGPPASSTPHPSSYSSQTHSAQSDSVNSAKRTKPKLLQLQTRTKHYESIDDLSPEYGGLPFVKKLKILNERQKLAELESVIKTRSVSLDIPENTPYDDQVLTRSHSEASAMHRRNSSTVRVPISPNESNETPERRNLKSILKKLSEDVRSVQPVGEDERETLQSPPGSSTGLETADLQPVASVASLVSPAEEMQEAGVQTLSMGVQTELNGLTSPDNNNLVVEDATPDPPKLIKSPLDEHEYFGEALLAIKHVISAHLQEMQQKFQQRFDKLEHEVKSRDLVITQLRQHINDLERSYDDSYTGSDSISTVISRMDRHSWDDPSNQESLELQDLPDSIRPHRAWSPEGRPFSSDTVIELDSATDTESELGDSDTPEQDNIQGLTHSNWEFEMLAAQMRQQRRSHSFDHSSHAHGLLRQQSIQGGARGTQARRRLLSRGYSADTGARD